MYRERILGIKTIIHCYHRYILILKEKNLKSLFYVYQHLMHRNNGGAHLSASSKVMVSWHCSPQKHNPFPALLSLHIGVTKEVASGIFTLASEIECDKIADFQFFIFRLGHFDCNSGDSYHHFFTCILHARIKLYFSCNRWLFTELNVQLHWRIRRK